jgi:hypothetical protein
MSLNAELFSHQRGRGAADRGRSRCFPSTKP